MGAAQLLRSFGWTLALAVAAAHETPAQDGAPLQAAAPAAPAALDAALAATFDEGMRQFDRLMGAGKFADARASLLALLAEHAHGMHVLLRLTEIQDDLERCAFRSQYVAPDPKSLVAGKLLSYDARSGKIKLRYEPKVDPDAEDPEPLQQLLALLGLGSEDEIGDFRWLGGAPMHPIVFAGPYSVEIAGRLPSPEDEDNFFGFLFTPQIVVDVGEGEYFIVSFGFPPTVKGNLTWSSRASLVHVAAGRSERVDEDDGTPLQVGKPYTVKVTVSGSAVTGSANGKTILKAPRKTDSYGQFGFRGCPNLESIEISGIANTAWIEGLVGADAQKAWTEFRKTWQGDALPEWLTPYVAAATQGDGEEEAEPEADPLWVAVPGPSHPLSSRHRRKLAKLYRDGEYEEGLLYFDKLPKGDSTEVLRDWARCVFDEALGKGEEALARCDEVVLADPAFVPARVVRARLLRETGRGPDAIADLRALVDGHAASAPETRAQLYSELAQHLIAEGTPQQAKEVIDEAIRAGLPPQLLSETDFVLLRALHGPTWDDAAEFRSRNYVVRSDIDRQVCADASMVLEQALGLYTRVLGRPDDAQGGTTYPVFLFASQMGYLAYAEDLLGSAPENTAGLFAPALDQLLIWNLPDRDGMMRTVRHEGFHQYLDRLLPGAPVWFNEGMAEYFENAGLEGGRMEHGQTHVGHVLLLTDKDTKWTPIADLVRGSRADFYAKAGLHYPEAWALLHHLLQSGREEQAVFDRYVAALMGGAEPDAAADALFEGVQPEALQKQVKKHLEALLPQDEKR